MQSERSVLADDLDRAGIGHHPVRSVRRTQLVGGPCARQARRALDGAGGLVPVVVAHGVGQHGRADVVPAGIDVVVDEDDLGRVGRRQQAQPGLVAVGACGLVVGLLQTGAVRLREEPDAVAPGATRRRLAAAAPGEHRHGRGERRGSDAGLGDPGVGVAQHLEQTFELLIGDGATAREVDAVELVLDRSIADAEHDQDPTLADVVEGDEVLGEADRVIQRQQRGTDHDRRVLGDRRHGGSHREGRRQVAVVGAVVLGDHERRAPVLIGPRRHLDGGAMQRGALLGAAPRCSEVEPHQVHGVPLLSSSTEPRSRMAAQDRRAMARNIRSAASLRTAVA